MSNELIEPLIFFLDNYEIEAKEYTEKLSSILFIINQEKAKVQLLMNEYIAINDKSQESSAEYNSSKFKSI